MPHGVRVGCAYFNWIATDMVKGADDTTLGGYMRSQLPGFLGKSYPVSDAVDALVAGVVNRRRFVMAPGWLRYMLPLRWWSTRALKPAMRPIVKKADKLASEEIERLGVEAASRPVGPGGAAAAKAHH
jgi:hypothetical protein